MSYPGLENRDDGLTGLLMVTGWLLGDFTYYSVEKSEYQGGAMVSWTESWFEDADDYDIMIIPAASVLAVRRRVSVGS